MAGSFNWSSMALCLVWAATFALCLVSSLAKLHRIDHPVNSDSLRVLVVGDWGRKGHYNQTEVAVQMGKVADVLDPAFIISTGDNFYGSGLTGTDDPQFEESFSNIYTAKSLQKQWYNVLGNHDYRGNVEAQLSPVLTKIDSRWLCMRSFIVNTEIAEIFFVDTTPFADKYFTHPGDETYDWSGITPTRKGYLSNLLKDLDSALKESTAKWKIVVGHHTLRSAGQHRDTVELVRDLLPILKADDVDLYINGHDHLVQHISSRDSKLQYFTSGGGSKAWRGDYDLNKEGLKFFYDGQGFMTVEITETDAVLIFYDVFGKVLYKWSVSKAYTSI
ncbi:purple acid phosphatase 3-like [Macadamia integrifolia]|uniref:purple acid phosphatase 3-like n=1 Tax=Macadamia integrifolia TaxID=60698 RepID=UPI001C4FF6B9|nr:purple acid phosphatase 3-like [Macadamia integrifolia]XP_042503119.1 purple acid phosphatase 3-like [Macadamia integrifolia]